EEFARRYFQGADPIGRHIENGHEIIGIVSNGMYRSLSGQASAAISQPVLGRTAGARGAVAPAVNAAVLAVDASAAVTLTPMRSALAFAMLPSRVGSAALGVLGGLGTVLAMVGLFGVVSFTVSRRTSEIAIR